MGNIEVLVASLGRATRVTIPAGSNVMAALNKAGVDVNTAKNIKVGGQDASIDTILNDNDSVYVLNKQAVTGGAGLASASVEFVTEGSEKVIQNVFEDTLTVWELVQQFATKNRVDLNLIKSIKTSTGEAVKMTDNISDGTTYVVELRDPNKPTDEDLDDDDDDMEDDD